MKNDIKKYNVELIESEIINKENLQNIQNILLKLMKYSKQKNEPTNKQ